MGLTEQEAYNKSMIIYNLMGDIKTGHIYYWDDGALAFNFRIPNAFGYLDSLITPDGDKYKIKISKGINIAIRMILYEVDGIDGDKLYNTFQDIIKFLDNEWLELDKSKKYATWRDYSKGKEIKYNDHGFIIAS